MKYCTSTNTIQQPCVYPTFIEFLVHANELGDNLIICSENISVIDKGSLKSRFLFSFF